MRKESVDFLFVCERPQREINSMILLCSELTKRGYSAKYIWGGDRTKKYNAKVLISNTLLTKEELYNGIYKFAGKIKKVVNLCWEQLADAEDVRKRFANRTKTATTFNYMFWGYGNYTKLVSDYIAKEQYKHIVGPIHLDFLRQQFNDLFESKEEYFAKYGIDCESKVLLYVSSFGFINPSKETIAIRKKLFGEEEYLKQRHFELESQSMILEWLEKLMDEDENITIVYRTHPGFDEGEKLACLSKREHFKCINDGILQQWIKVVDGIMMLNSTSLAECCILNKQTYVLRPYDVPDILDCVFYEGIQPINNYETFKSMVHSKKGQSSVAYKNVYDISETPTYIRLCDELEKIISSDAYNVKWNIRDIFYLYVSVVRDSLFRIKSYIKKPRSDEIVYNWDGCLDEMPILERKIKKAVERYNHVSD